MKSRRTALVLAPHTDDGEFGCGATINKLINSGWDVYYVAFSACEQSVLPHFPKDILVTEVKLATKVLGIKPENLILFNYEVRTFNFHRQDILNDMIKLRNEIRPSMIFIPTISDVHQDHQTIAHEALRAFKFSSILSYELPWNNFHFTSSYYFPVDEENMLKKLNALKEYKSQSHRDYADDSFIYGLARVRGVQIGVQFAEAFELKRMIYDED